MSGVELWGRAACLRGVQPGDAGPAFAILHGNRAILDWLEWPGPETVADMAARCSVWRAHGEGGDDFAFAIEERASGAFAGALTLRFAGHAGVGVVGYWIDPHLWGRGLATDAVRLASWLAFECLDAQALCARVHHGNERSRRVLLRCGWREAPLTEVPDQPGCGARPQWAFRLERAEYEAHGRVRPDRARVALG